MPRLAPAVHITLWISEKIVVEYSDTPPPKNILWPAWLPLKALFSNRQSGNPVSVRCRRRKIQSKLNSNYAIYLFRLRLVNLQPPYQKGLRFDYEKREGNRVIRYVCQLSQAGLLSLRKLVAFNRFNELSISKSHRWLLDKWKIPIIRPL